MYKLHSFSAHFPHILSILVLNSSKQASGVHISVILCYELPESSVKPLSRSVKKRSGLTEKVITEVICFAGSCSKGRVLRVPACLAGQIVTSQDLQDMNEN